MTDNNESESRSNELDIVSHMIFGANCVPKMILKTMKNLLLEAMPEIESLFEKSQTPGEHWESLTRGWVCLS